MKKDIGLAERLIVAADFSPTDCGGAPKALDALYDLLSLLEGTGVMIKINSLLRFAGYGLIKELHEMDLKVFADLKLTDIPKTLQYDGEFLRHYQPELLTAMCSSGTDSLVALRNAVGPQTEVLGVTVLTSLTRIECMMIHNNAPDKVVQDLALLAQEAKLGGLILSANELGVVTVEYRMSRNCPGIRPTWHIDPNDDQSRIMTPAKAILAGADRLVMGRPITKHHSPREAVEMTLQEIEHSLKDRE